MKKILVTHTGRFHADEVFATAILSLIYKNNIEIHRVLDSDAKNYVNNPNAIIYDIGRGEFDHHQHDPNAYRENGIPYAACGLIWKAFYMELLYNLPDGLRNFTVQYIDKMLIQGIDDIDNGHFKSHNSYDPMNVTTVIGLFNPPSPSTQEEQMKQFKNAVRCAKTILLNLLSKAKETYNAINAVNKAINERDEPHILILPEYMPWKGTLHANPFADNIWYVIYPSNRIGYNIEAVPITPNGTDKRQDVPTAWWGKENEELAKITGVETAFFCHFSGFLSACKTLDDAIKFARLAVDEVEELFLEIGADL